MKYGVWAKVWGGITGSRAAWLKSHGEIKLFETREDAETEAARLISTSKPTPYGAQFSYEARPFPEDWMRQIARTAAEREEVE